MADLADDQTGEMEAAGYPNAHPTCGHQGFSNAPLWRCYLDAGHDGDHTYRVAGNPTYEEYVGKRPIGLLLGEAFRIAVEVHGNQRDKGGAPYMEHVLRVMLGVGDDDTDRCVAILHDTVEDTPGKMLDGDSYLPTAKMRLLLRIETSYGRHISYAVAALTRMDDEPYMQYIRRVAQNPLARTAKLADLATNMSEPRLRKLPMHEADRLRKKYREAWDYLMGIVR